MSSQRFAPEFKDEAVRQIVERGHPVSEVAERLGVSAFPTRPAVPSTAGDMRISWFSRTKVPHMYRVFDRAGPPESLR